MSGDVVDFSPVRQTYKRPRPNWQTGTAAVPLAVLGAALGAASLFGEWSSFSMPNGAASPAMTMSTLGSLGTAYAVALIALVTVAALVFFGDFPGGTKNLRVAGIALSASSLAVVGAIASLLTDEGEGPVFFDFASAAQAPTQSLSWGIYAAFGGLIALGVALLLPPVTRRPRGETMAAVEEEEDDAEFEGDAVDLTVTVEPVRGTGR